MTPMFQIKPYGDETPIPVIDLDDVTRHYMREYTGAILSPFGHPHVVLYNDGADTYRDSPSKANKKIMKRLQAFQAEQRAKEQAETISLLCNSVARLEGEIVALRRELAAGLW